MNYRLFNMRSNQLISDFDFVPEDMSEEQEKTCEDCRYRWYRIDLDIKRYTRRYSIKWNEVPPRLCDRKECLINEQAETKTYLNQNQLTKQTKEAGK